MSEARPTWPHGCDLEEDPAAARRRLAVAAEAWGGSFEEAPGTTHGTVHDSLVLPVLAGLRRGFVEGPVRIEERGKGSRVSYQVAESQYRLDLPAALTLLLGALGALLTLVAPFFPSLWRLVPVGMMLSVGSWLFIVARLRNSGPEEFFQDLETGEVLEGE